MTQGKCRYPGTSNSYSRSDVYNLKNTRFKVNTEKGCAERCSADSECEAFQYYQADPGAYDNCNIWKSKGYTGNGNSKSKCYNKVSKQPNERTLLTHRE